MFFKLQELAAFPRLFYFFSKRIFMFLSFFSFQNHNIWKLQYTLKCRPQYHYIPFSRDIAFWGSEYYYLTKYCGTWEKP